jgi:hypothetical protein
VSAYGKEATRDQPDDFRTAIEEGLLPDADPMVAEHLDNISRD